MASLDPLRDLSGVEADSAPILVFLLAENTEVAINSGERRSGRGPLLFASSGRGRQLRRTRDTAGACCGLASGGLLFGGCMVEVRKITKRGRKGRLHEEEGSPLHNLCGLDRKEGQGLRRAGIKSERA